ncbi:MAG: ABC transporter permease [Microthrixaceae bacterium]
MSSPSGRRPGIGMWRMIAALVRQRRRLLLATVAIALSVGYLAGALTLLNRVSEGLADLAAAGAERADLIVEGDVAYESALEQTRRLVPSSIAESLIGQPGIAAVVPRIEEVTVLLGPDFEPIVAPGLSEQPMGANWPDDEQISPYRFVGDGRAPEGSDEVVIDERSARIAGFEVGDQVAVWGKTDNRSYEIVGIVTTAEGELPDGSSLALFSTEEARRLFGTPTNDNRVAIRLTDDADVDEVSARIAAMLPSGSVLVDGETGAQHRQESLTRSFALIRVLIMGFAGLALVVGMVTVANSLTLLYSDRRHTFATFRLVGAKQHQLLTVALTEAALLAGVASLVGAPLGLVLGRLIEGALGTLGTSIPVGGSVISVSALVTAVVVGALATVLAAVVPAWRACRVAAIDAIVEPAAARGASVGLRMLRAILVGIAVAALVWGFMVIADVAPERAGLVAGIVLAVVVVGSMLSTVLSYAVGAGIRLVPSRSGALRRIGSRDAVRNRTRTAATTGALLLATAVVAGLAVFLASFADSVDSDVGDLVVADLVVDSGTFTRGGLPGALLTDLRELPEVVAVSGWQVGRGYIGDVPVRLTGMDGASLDEVLDPTWVGKPPDTLGTDGVLLSETTAAQLGVDVGSMVPLTFTSLGVETLRVEGIYSTGGLLLGEAVLDRELLSSQVPASTDIAGLVTLEEDTPAARDAVVQMANAQGVTSVLEPSEFVDRRADLLRGFERVIQWMLLFTLVQALVGVVNTLLLSVGERRREFGLLRAAGASRRQILQLVLVEGSSFAVVGTILGLVVGTVGARAAVAALGRFGIDGFVVPVPILVLTAVLAMLLGVIAAVVPARWAAAVPPLEAVVDSGGMPTMRRRRTRRTVAAPGIGQAVPVPAAAAPAGTAIVATGATGGIGAVPPPLPPHLVPTAPLARDAAPERVVAEAAPHRTEIPAPYHPPAAEPAPVGAPPVVEPAVVEPAVGPAPVVEPSEVPVAEPATPVEPTPVEQPAEPVPVAARVGDSTHVPTGPTARRGGRDSSVGWVRSTTAPDPRGQEPRGRRLFGPARGPRPTPAAAGPVGPRRAPTVRRADPRAPGGAPAHLSSELAAALARLHPESVHEAGATLAALDQALRPDERLLHVVQGWAKGLPCVVARTDRRILVVVSRFPEPLVDSLHPTRTTMSLYGPPGTARVSLAVVDGRRLLEVTGIRDRGEAAAIRVPPTPSTASRGRGYF